MKCPQKMCLSKPAAFEPAWPGWMGFGICEGTGIAPKLSSSGDVTLHIRQPMRGVDTAQLQSYKCIGVQIINKYIYII